MSTIMYTDGSYLWRFGLGGYCAIILEMDYEENIQQKEIIQGNGKNANQNIMEMKAIIEGLKYLQGKTEKLTIVSDHPDIKSGIQIWIHKWKKNGWRTSRYTHVQSKDLWQELEALASEFDINWQWVKGHSGDKWNEEAHMIAREEAYKFSS